MGPSAHTGLQRHLLLHLINLQIPVTYPAAGAALMGSVSWAARMQPATPSFSPHSVGMGMRGPRLPASSRATHANLVHA